VTFALASVFITQLYTKRFLFSSVENEFFETAYK
jgi:hypothetical protein